MMKNVLHFAGTQKRKFPKKLDETFLFDHFFFFTYRVFVRLRIFRPSRRKRHFVPISGDLRNRKLFICLFLQRETRITSLIYAPS